MNLRDLYLDYAKDITDAPPIFHTAMAYFMASSVINKKVFMPFGYRKLYPNLFILLGAPSSLHRKSWSQDMAINLINEVSPQFELPEFTSRSAFIAEFADSERPYQNAGMFAIDELSGFMKRIKYNKHFEGFMQDLSSLYDSKTLTRRAGVSDKDKKVYTISDPFLNFTAACSLDWLTESTNSTDITGGFLARFLWIIVDTKVTDPMDEPGEQDLEKKNQIIKKLYRLQQFTAMAGFNAEAKQNWRNWYKDFRRKYQGGTWDANYERLTTITKKIAMLNTIMRLEDVSNQIPVGSIDINEEDLSQAILFTTDTVSNFDKVIVGDSPREVLTQRTRKYIWKHGPVAHSALMRNIRGLDSWMLKTIIQTLEESEEIEVIGKNGGGGIGATYYNRNSKSPV